MLIFWSTTAWRALITKHFPIDEAVYELFCNPVRLETVRRTMSEIAHPMPPSGWLNLSCVNDNTVKGSTRRRVLPFRAR